MAKENIFVDIDFNQNQLLNPVLQNLPEDPSTGVEGQKYFNTTNHIERTYRNGAWQNTTDEYELPAASTNTRGGIKVGSHLNVTNTDVLNADEASTTQKGVVEIATDEEVTAGTDTERVVTPHGLNIVTEPIKGDIEDLQESNFLTGWRTPTKDEWTYLINTRSASTVGSTTNARYVKARVNGINGLILLPDIFSLPSGITMYGINTANRSFSSTSYNLSQWISLENAGCVFLPSGGTRNVTTIYELTTRCYYRASTTYSYNTGYDLYVDSQNVKVTKDHDKYYGQNVRLVKESTNGKFSLSATLKGDIAKGNLQYHCFNKEWRFAHNAYDVIGNANSNIAEDYNGWIDLFGFGTSGWNSRATAYQPWSTSNNNQDYIHHNLTGNYKNADWGVYNIKKQLHNIAFTGNYNDLENVPLGEAGGIAELDVNGKVPSSQLPSYVDDVIEGYLYNNHFYEDSAHTILSPADQESGKIFVDLQDNLSYRWSGSTYVEVSQSLALGETSSTAYRGDRGKVAYDHATDANRITTAQSSGLYKIAVTSEGHVASVTATTASDIPTQDATETQKGVIELATSAEAIAATDTERAVTPKTNDDAFESRFWKGTESQFKALGTYSQRVTYYVEAQDDDSCKIHWTNTFSTLVSNSQLKSGDMYAVLPSASTDRRQITNLYLATSVSTYITIWSV
jgi:hypothetical protein